MLPFLIIYALPVAFIDMQIVEHLGGGIDTPNAERVADQGALIRVILAATGVGILLEGTIAPLLAAISVYIGRNWLAGKARSFSGGINFAFSRYTRMWRPHFVSQIAVIVGGVVLIPGVLAQLLFAFADSVSAIEDEAKPLTRSRKLTRGRRGRIFFTWLPLFIASQGYFIFELSVMPKGLLYVVGAKVGYLLLVMVTWVAFFLHYDDRVRGKKKKAARKDSAGSASAV